MDDHATTCTVESCSSSDDKEEDYFDLIVWHLGPKGEKTILNLQENGLGDNPFPNLGKAREYLDAWCFRDDTNLHAYQHVVGTLETELTNQEETLRQDQFGTEIRVLKKLLGEDRASLREFFDCKDANFRTLTQDEVLELARNDYQQAVALLDETDVARRAIQVVVNRAERLRDKCVDLFSVVIVPIKAMLFVAYTLMRAYQSFESNEDDEP